MHSSLLYRSHRRHYNRLSPGPIYKYISCSIVFRIIIVFNCCRRRYVVRFFNDPVYLVYYTTLFYKRGVCELLIFFFFIIFFSFSNTTFCRSATADKTTNNSWLHVFILLMWHWIFFQTYLIATNILITLSYQTLQFHYNNNIIK